MKLRYLAGCAAVAVTMGAGAAVAQDFKVVISGDSENHAFFGSQDQDTNSRSVEFRNRVRVVMDASAKNDWLTYGARVRIRTTNSSSSTSDGAMSYDRAYVYGKGSFGSVYFGNISNAGDENDWERPVAHQLGADEAPIDFVSKTQSWSGLGLSATHLYQRHLTLNSGDSMIRYDSPIFSGFGFVVGYTPKTGEKGWSIDRQEDGTTGRIHDLIEAELLFDSTNATIKDRFGDFILRGRVDFETGKYDKTNSKDVTAFETSLQLGYKGFLVGGSYRSMGESMLLSTDTQKINHYNYTVGAEYAFSGVTVGASYTRGKKDASFTSSGTGAITLGYFEVGAAYKVAPGLDVGIDYANITIKNTAPTRNTSDTANVVTVGAKVSF